MKALSMSPIIAGLVRSWTAIQKFRVRMSDVLLFAVFTAYASAAYAQSAPGGLTSVVSGVCRFTRFVSEVVIFAVLGLAIAAYGIMFAMNSMRDGAMEGGLRIAFGGGISMSAVAIVTYIFNQGVC